MAGQDTTSGPGAPGTDTDAGTSTLTIKVPDVGEGIAEVELVSWAVAEGETVARNQIVAEVMTDKATVEVPAPVDGIVHGLTGSVGEILLVGSPLFTMRTDGPAPDGQQADEQAASSPASGASTESPSPSPAESTASMAAPAPAPAATTAGNGSANTTAGRPPIGQGAPRAEGRRPTATPAVRRRAREAGIDLRTIPGTGPAGRITHEDLDAAFAAGPGRPQHGRSGRWPVGENLSVDEQPIVGMRRRIAEQMVASTSTIPHITYVDEVDMTALEELRTTLNDRAAATADGDANGDGQDQPRLTVLPFLVRALVAELGQFPAMNAHVIESSGPGQTDVLKTFGGVNVGVATQTDNGLVVPVVHHAETLNLWDTARRVGELADAARTGRADVSDLTGSTITITSLGALGGLVTTPVINKPETTIVGVNKMAVRPVWSDGQFVPRKMMNLSCSFDHRVIDGWDAARFVQAVKRALEQPALLFVEGP